MRVSKIVLTMVATLTVCGASILSLSCAAKPSATPAQQTTTVQRGNLVIYVTGTGNLALSRTENLAFDIAGTVAQVLVNVADSVKQGQVVATLDSSDWDSNIRSLRNSLLQTQISVKNAQYNLEQAEDTTATSITGDIVTSRSTDPEQIEILELQVEMANAKLLDAQKALDDALASSPEVTATFDGFITSVSVSGGDEVKKGTVAVTLADPTRFDADILVSEVDISGVKLGGDATIGIDAMSGIRLPAKVTFISPTATIQSGVVNYRVTVEVTSLQPVPSAQPGQGGTTRPATGGQGQTPRTPSAGQGTPTATPTPTSTPTPQTVQLRQGLSVTVNIPVQEKDNVLLVPNRAITRQQGVTYVNVLKSEGTIEKRQIQTGITDFQNTEVTSGLTEGEKVVIPQTTSTTSTPSPGGGGGFRIPGL